MYIPLLQPGGRSPWGIDSETLDLGCPADNVNVRPGSCRGGADGRGVLSEDEHVDLCDLIHTSQKFSPGSFGYSMEDGLSNSSQVSVWALLGAVFTLICVICMIKRPLWRAVRLRVLDSLKVRKGERAKWRVTSGVVLIMYFLVLLFMGVRSRQVTKALSLMSDKAAAEKVRLSEEVAIVMAALSATDQTAFNDGTSDKYVAGPSPFSKFANLLQILAVMTLLLGFHCLRPWDIWHCCPQPTLCKVVGWNFYYVGVYHVLGYRLRYPFCTSRWRLLWACCELPV